MSKSWIGKGTEKALKIAYEHQGAVLSAAADDRERVIARVSQVAIHRLIRQKPVRVNECPACRKHMMIHHNFCPDCGQALDWQQEG